MIDLILDWEEAANVVRVFGWDAWLRYVGEQFPRCGLFDSSMDWFRHGPEYIAKLRGVKGDVIVGWKK